MNGIGDLPIYVNNDECSAITIGNKSSGSRDTIYQFYKSMSNVTLLAFNKKSKIELGDYIFTIQMPTQYPASTSYKIADEYDVELYKDIEGALFLSD